MLNDFLHYIGHKLNDELTEMYISVAIRNFAIALFAIFIPVYLYAKLGYSLSQVSMYFIVFYLFAGFAFLLSSKISDKYGFKKNMLLSSIILIVGLISLYLLESNAIWFYISAITIGSSVAMFWFSVHTDMAHLTKGKRGSSRISWIFIIIGMGGILGPLLAGIILEYWGFNLLFVIASILILLSSVPLSLSKDYRPKAHLTFKEIISHLKHRRSFAYFAEGTVTFAATILWPLFVYMVLTDYLDFGSLFSAFAVLSLFTYYLVGKIVQHKGTRKILILGGMLFGATIFARAFVTNLIGIVIVMIFGSLTWGMMIISMHKLIYLRARKERRLSEIISRELVLQLGRIFILLVLILTNSFQISFIVTGISTVLFKCYK